MMTHQERACTESNGKKFPVVIVSASIPEMGWAALLDHCALLYYYTIHVLVLAVLLHASGSPPSLGLHRETEV